MAEPEMDAVTADPLLTLIKKNEEILTAVNKEKHAGMGVLVSGISCISSRCA